MYSVDGMSGWDMGGWDAIYEVGDLDGLEGAGGNEPANALSRDGEDDSDTSAPQAQVQPVDESAPRDFDTLDSDGGDQGDGSVAAGNVAGTDGNGDEASGGGGPGGSCSTVGDPIDVRLADKRHVQVDYAASGPASLRVARVYHSNLVAHPASVTIPMGAGWRSHYDRSVQLLSASAVRLHRANGRVMDFTFNGSSWVSALPAGVLTQVPSGWQYVNHRNMVETYSAAGRLLSLTQGGLVTSLGYDAAGRLVQVTNPFGRALSWTYDGAGRVASITQPSGGLLRYGYDASNNLISVTFADGAVRRYTYENPNFRNALTGVIDESGRRKVTWGYDSAGRPNLNLYGNGTNRLDIAYSGNQVTTWDARGAVRTRVFASAGGRSVLATLQTAATASTPAATASYSYDAIGNLQSMTTRTGEIRQFSGDARGRTLSATLAAGNSYAQSAATTWHPVFRQPLTVSSKGVTQSAVVDGYGRITQVSKTGSDGVTSVVQQLVYNTQHLLQSVTDARGATTTFAYDAQGNRTSVTNAQGQITSFSDFDPHGRARRIVRSDGTVILRGFDTRGRLTSRSVGGVVTGYAYDDAGRITQITAADGGWERRSYDAAGNLSERTNNRGERIALGRDVDARINTVATYAASGTLAMGSSREFDALGRRSAVVDAQSNRTRFTFGADTRPSGVTNPLGQDVSFKFDQLSRPVQVSQPNTSAMISAGGLARVAATLDYDPVKATHRSTTDTVSVPTGYAYDALNRRVAEGSVDAGSRSVARNVAGDAVSVTDARGVTLAIARDSLGRVTSITPPTGAAITYNYVPGRSDSLLASMTDASGNTTWTYDSQGRLLTKSQLAGADRRTATVSRDTLGRVVNITYPSGMRVGYAYSADLVSAITVNGVNLLTNVTYLPFSKVATGWSWGNGRTYSRTFDTNGRITSVDLGSFMRNYSYDAAGRVASYTDVSGSTSTGHNLAYDTAGQLISYAGPEGSFNYAYDTNGNRRSAVQYGVTSALSYQAGTNRLLTGPRGNYTYDAAGNPTSDGHLSFSYDAYGQLTTMTGPSGDYLVRAFNGQRMRVSSTSWLWETDCDSSLSAASRSPAGKLNSGGLAGGASAAPKIRRVPITRLTTTRDSISTKATTNKLPPGGGCTRILSLDSDSRFFHDDDGKLLGEYGIDTGDSQETIWFNGMPVGVMYNGALLYAKADHLGSPRSLARASDNAEVWRWDGDPFGNRAPTNPSGGIYTYSLRMPGQQYERYGGYYYNWMRDYDPYTGRYIQADPIGLSGGLSRYTYVGGNPISLVDATGLAGVTFSFGGEVTVGPGAAAGSGGYFAFDTRTSGAMTYTGTMYGLNSGVGFSIGAFFGKGIDLLQGSATSANFSIAALALSLTFSNNYKDGILGLTGISVGAGASLPIGLSVGTTNTKIISEGAYLPPKPAACQR